MSGIIALQIFTPHPNPFSKRVNTRLPVHYETLKSIFYNTCFDVSFQFCREMAASNQFPISHQAVRFTPITKSHQGYCYCIISVGGHYGHHLAQNQPLSDNNICIIFKEQGKSKLPFSFQSKRISNIWFKLYALCKSFKRL